MEFTKEEIKVAKKVFESYQTAIYKSFEKKLTDVNKKELLFDQRNQPSYTCYLDSLIKPETKKIVVEVEYQEDLSAEKIQNALHWNNHAKVTELPEVFSREQVIDIFDNSFTSKDYIDGLIDRWLSERNK